MAKQLQLRRGTTAANDLFTGANGEVTVDTSNHSLRVHNGATQGGFLVDTVIAFQRPSIDNNYTWYRKYASGWVEQGGVVAGDNNWAVGTCNLVVTMADTNYVLQVTDVRPDATTFTDSNSAVIRHATRSSVVNLTTTSFQHQTHDTIMWQVSGVAA